MSDTLVSVSPENQRVLWPIGITRQHLLIILVAVVAPASLFLLQESRAGVFGFPWDDSWIHLRFAQNVARGYGLSLNKGQPVAGSTAPLWTLALAIPHIFLRSTGAIIWAAKLAGVTLLFLSSILVYGITLTIINERQVAVVAAMLTGSMPLLTYGSLSGMETSLYVFLSLAGIFCYQRYSDELNWKQYASTVFFGLATMARPECLVLFIIASAYKFLSGLREHPRLSVAWLQTLNLLRHTILLSALLSPYALFNYTTSGSVFPNTYAAKTTGANPLSLSHILVKSPFTYLLDLAEGLMLDNAVLLGGLIVSIALLTWRRQFVDQYSKRCFLLMILPTYVTIRAWIVPAGASGFLTPLGAGQRYVSNLLPLFVILGVVSLHDVAHHASRLLTRLPSSLRWRAGPRSIWPILSTFAFIFQAIAALYVSGMFAAMVKETTTLNVHLGLWLDHNTSADASLATHDIGAIAYFTDREIVDTVGLTSPDLLPFIRSALAQGKPRDDGLLEYLTLRQPDYLIIDPDWYPHLAHRDDLFTQVYSVRWVRKSSGIRDILRTFLHGLVRIDMKSERKPLRERKFVVYKTIWTE